MLNSKVCMRKPVLKTEPSKISSKKSFNASGEKGIC